MKTDASIRPHLRQWLARHWHTCLIDEMPVGASRIDIACIGRSTLRGYEIKAEGDSLRRLKSQAFSYGRLFDNLALVTTECHVAHALEILPGYWEVIQVYPSGEGLAFESVRSGSANDELNRERRLQMLLSMLWRSEMDALLKSYGLAKNSKYGSRTERLLMVELDEPRLRGKVCRILRARRNWRTAEGKSVMREEERRREAARREALTKNPHRHCAARSGAA